MVLYMKSQFEEKAVTKPLVRMWMQYVCSALFMPDAQPTLIKRDARHKKQKMWWATWTHNWTWLHET